jgi:dCMP deaminase
MKPVLVLYVPVIHRGYLGLFEKYKEDVEDVYLLGPELIKEFFSLHKEIRAVDPETTKKFIESLGLFKHVSILTSKTINELNGRKIIAVSEEVSRQFAARYLTNNEIEYDSVFLRWDESNVKSVHKPSFAAESDSEFDRTIMARAEKNSENSSCWWRHVGGVVVKNGKILIEGNNTHLPQEQIQYIEGDPRDFVEAGTSPEIATTLHGEMVMIAEAARKGISLDGASMYLTVFPCHPCAKLMARSGIKKCFFRSGNAYMNSEKVLEAAGVEIIWVK